MVTIVRAGQRAARAWLGERNALATLAFVFVAAVVQVVGSHGAGDNQPDRRALDAVAVALLVAGPAALALRRRRPVEVVAAVLGITLAYLLLGYPYGPAFLSPVVALYTAVVEGHRLVAWLGAAAFLVTHVAGELVLGRRPPLTLAGASAVVAWLVVVLVVSEGVRVRRDRALEAERNVAEEARRRESEERLRIARELHDVLAHNISLINVQAGVALHLIDEQPEQARTALAAIKDASKDVLREIRSTLGVLRQVDEPAPLSPTPTLERLPELVAGARSTGLEVEVGTSGTRGAIPVAVDSAAFRIVQEALTNVTRHSGARRATVLLRYGERDLVVEVTDDGRGTPASAPRPGGHGILGMRERATALGGTLEAGPRPGGGFCVLARLPIGEDD